MNNPDQGFEAFLTHPDLGNEMAEGKIVLEARRLVFESPTISLEIPFESLLLDYDQETGQINFIDRDQREVTCFTTDESILDHWALIRSNHTRHQVKRIRIRDDTSRRVKLTLYAFLACGLLIWVGSFVFDAIVRSVVMSIPMEWERQFGDKELAELRKDKEIVFLDDTNRVAQLAALAEPLTSRLSGGSNAFRFYIVDDPEMNAFAMPGGNVIVLTGLLENTERPEELLGVLAHEIAHVRKRHHFQEAISGAGPMLVLRILMSDRNGRLNIMTEVSGELISQSFSRKHESEADDVGWDYLVAANVNPHGMIDMFKKLNEGEFPEPGALEAFSSHPALQKRIRHLEERWEKLPGKTDFLVLTNSLSGLTNAAGDKSPEKLFKRR